MLYAFRNNISFILSWQTNDSKLFRQILCFIYSEYILLAGCQKACYIILIDGAFKYRKGYRVIICSPSRNIWIYMHMQIKKHSSKWHGNCFDMLSHFT